MLDLTLLQQAVFRAEADDHTLGLCAFGFGVGVQPACAAQRLDPREVDHLPAVSTIGKPDAQAGDLIEVRYLYATGARRLYQAIYLRKRDDQSDSDCTIDQLIFKQGVER